ncbi:MAG TPA: aminotransferase class IV [Chitinophagaceae bacterium]|nr:aminotransferase class IV [Chitinophagaceae bacterium]
MGYLIQNGKTINASKPILSADNRSFRYGDGCFETIRVYNGKLLMRDLHFERLFSTMRVLKFSVPQSLSAEYLEGCIQDLCKKNGAFALGRVRLTIYRSDGLIHESTNPSPNFVIQAWPLSKEVVKLNDHGLTVDFFPGARKSCDELSNLKSNNYLPYVMAAIHAREKKLNDCFVLNTHERVADSTVANVFLIRNNQISTPSLTEGCVAGVTRKYLLQLLHLNGIKVTEKHVTQLDCLHADEIFLSNALSGVKWVASCGIKKYRNLVVKQIHSLLHLSLLF